MMASHLGELAALGTAFCWTVTAMSFESAGRRVGSLAVNLIRLILAFGFLTLLCWISRGRPLPTDASPHAWLWLGLSGLVGFSIGDLCLFRAFLLVGSRVSMLLMSLVPPLAAVTGWLFLGEQLSGVDWLAMGLTVAGVTWVVSERPGRDHETGAPGSADRSRGAVAPVAGARTEPPTARMGGLTLSSRSHGILLGLGAAVGQAVGLVLSKFGMGPYDPFAATQIRVIAGVASFSALFFAIAWWPRVFAALTHPGAMGRISLGALFGPFLGVSLSLVAVQRTQAGVAATIMSIVPVLIIAPTILVFRQAVSMRAIAGAIIAVAGVALLFCS